MEYEVRPVVITLGLTKRLGSRQSLWPHRCHEKAKISVAGKDYSHPRHRYISKGFKDATITLAG
jgi:hypothetical protein